MRVSSSEGIWRSLGMAAGVLLALTFVLPHPPDWDLGSTWAAWFAGVLRSGLCSRNWVSGLRAVCQTVSACSDYAIALLVPLAMIWRGDSRKMDRVWLALLLGTRIVDSSTIAVVWLLDSILLPVLIGSGPLLAWTIAAALMRGDRVLHVAFVSTVALSHWFVQDWLLPRNQFDPSDHLAGASSVLLLVSVIALAKLRTNQPLALTLRDLILLRVARQRIGYCPSCDYDLRGLPEMRCPECGRPFTINELGTSPESLSNPADE